MHRWAHRHINPRPQQLPSPAHRAQHLPRDTAAGGESLIPASLLTELCRLLSHRFSSTQTLRGQHHGAEALISQMKKLRLREGICPGLQPGVCAPNPTLTQSFKEAAGPREVGRRSGEHGDAGALGMALVPAEGRALGDLAESRGVQVARWGPGFRGPGSGTGRWPALLS